MLTAEGPAFVACDHCGRAIGVYEPLVVFQDGEPRASCRAEEFALPLRASYFHHACYETLMGPSITR